MSSNKKHCSLQVGLKDSGYEEGGRERLAHWIQRNCTGNAPMERSGWNHHVHIAKLAAQQTGVNCERCSTWDVVWWKVLHTLLHKIRASFFFTTQRLKTTGAAALTSQMRQICEKPHFFLLFFLLACPPFVIPVSFPQTLCFLGSATSFSLSLGCSSVVAYTRFPVMFSLLSSALLVYHKPI